MTRSTPDKQSQRLNGRSSEDLFFDMDGMDDTELQTSTQHMTHSDDEDAVDNDDSQCGRWHFLCG